MKLLIIPSPRIMDAIKAFAVAAIAASANLASLLAEKLI